MSITFPDVETAVAATVQPVVLYVRIGGTAVAATEATTRHSVDQPIGTCTVVLEAPGPSVVAINAELEIEMGYAGASRRTFHGFVTQFETVTDDRGRWLRVDGLGWGSWLADESYSSVEIAGPVSLKDAFRSLCELRSIPAYLSDDTTYPDGMTEIELGGNSQINAGHIRFANTVDPMTWLTRVSELFGYRVFDSPDGTTRLARVSGLPLFAEDLVPASDWIAEDQAVTTTSQLLFAGMSLATAHAVGDVSGGTPVRIVNAAIAQPEAANGTFASTIGGWTERWNPAGFVYTASRDASVFSDSAGSLNIAVTNVPDIGDLLVYGMEDGDRLPAMPGFTYSWTCALRKDHATDLNTVIRLEFFDADGAYIDAEETACPNTANTWFTVSVSGQAPSGTRWQMLTFGVYTTVSSIGATRNAWIDAIAPAASSSPWIEVEHATLGTGWLHAENAGASVLMQPQSGVTFEEGVNCFSLEKRSDTRNQYNFVEVLGARYTAADGGAVQIRSIAEEVPNEEALEPLGYRHRRISSQDIVTDVQAAGVRNVQEIDHSEVQEYVSWETWGNPTLQPGDVVTLTGATHGLTAQRLWLMRIDQSVSDRGYMATMTGWYGAGAALPAGNDCRTEAVTISPDGVLHMGNETLSWYKDPSADGTEVTINITVTSADYTSLRLTGLCHGTNSYRNNVAVTGSKIEVWQLPNPSLPAGPTNEIRRAGSVDLPTANEELSKRRNYSSSNTYWQSFSLPLSGNLKEGAAELRVISGEIDDEIGSGYDDFEIKDLELTYCGVGIPDLPGVG